MKTETSKIQLRELVIGDLDNIHALHSLPETDRFNTLGIPENIGETEKPVESWIESQNKIPRKKYVFCIEDIEKNFIGLLGINMGKPNYRKAEIWYKVHPSYWNNGLATDAVKAALQFCFEQLHLHRVEAGCAVANMASVKVLEKAGFVKEGIERKNLPIRGEWVDNYTFSILEEEFIKTIKDL